MESCSWSTERNPFRLPARVIFVVLGTTCLVTALIVPAVGSSATATGSPTNWAPQSPVASPSMRSGSSMAYDPTIGEIVLFGGTGANHTALPDPWTYHAPPRLPLPPP